jgi:hypothetical protein
MKQFFKTRVEWILLIIALMGHLVLLSTRMNESKQTPLLRAWTMEVAYPFLAQAVGSVTSVSNVWRNYIDLRSIREENGALKGQLEDYRQASSVV